jgi:hypothetical protein
MEEGDNDNLKMKHSILNQTIVKKPPSNNIHCPLLNKEA